MLFGKDVTIYHLEADGETYTVNTYQNASVHRRCAAVCGGKGLQYDNTATVRIPGDFALLADIGDYIFTGENAPDMPDKTKCLAILGITDNRRGSPAMHHWRIEAK